jgi:hypothetical protein
LQHRFFPKFYLYKAVQVRQSDKRYRLGNSRLYSALIPITGAEKKGTPEDAPLIAYYH